MATRLLDWTRSPLAALWFAVENPPIGDGVLWVFEPEEDSVLTHEQIKNAKSGPFNRPRTSVFQPNHITQRIVAQSGWFTVHKYLEKEERFIPLEKNSAYKRHLTKLMVPAANFSDLRYELDRLGINRASLFPDLEGLCTQIQWENTLLSDEPET